MKTSKLDRRRDSSNSQFPVQLGFAAALLILLGSFPLFACSQEGIYSELRSPEPGVVSMESDTAASTKPASTRKLIHNAELSLEVEGYTDARAAIDKELDKVGGFVKNATVHHQNGRVSSAHLILSIPSASLSSTLQVYGELGTVLYETLSTQDVTEQHFDLSARLANARKLETRLLELLKTEAKELKDLLEVERELSRVRETIELLDGRLHSLDSQVAFSTLNLQLTTRDFYVPAAPQSIGDEIGDAFSRSLSGMASFARGLLIVSVALLPWLIPLGLIGWFCLRLLRRRSKRSRSQAAANSASAE